MSMENSLDPVALFRQREEKRAQNNPNANVDERVEQDIIREIRDGNGSLEQKQNLYNQLSPEAKRSTPISPELKNSLQPSQEQLQKQRDALMESMWSNPTHDTQDAITKIDRELENRFAVDPLYKRLGKDDPNLLNARREKLVSKMLSEPDEATQTEIRDIDEKLKKINSPKPTESQDQSVATPEAVKNELPLPPEWDLLEEDDEEEINITGVLKDIHESDKLPVNEESKTPLSVDEAIKYFASEQPRLLKLVRDFRESHLINSNTRDDIQDQIDSARRQLDNYRKSGLIFENKSKDSNKGYTFVDFMLQQEKLIKLAEESLGQRASKKGTLITRTDPEFFAEFDRVEEEMTEDFRELHPEFQSKNSEVKSSEEDKKPETPLRFSDGKEVDSLKAPLEDDEPHIVVSNDSSPKEQPQPRRFSAIRNIFANITSKNRSTTPPPVPVLTDNPPSAETPISQIQPLEQAIFPETPPPPEIDALSEEVTVESSSSANQELAYESHLNENIDQEIAEVDQLSDKEVVERIVPEMSSYHDYDDLPKASEVHSEKELIHALVSHANFIQTMFNEKAVDKSNYGEVLAQRKDISQKEIEFLYEPNIYHLISNGVFNPALSTYHRNYISALYIPDGTDGNLSDQNSGMLHVDISHKSSDERVLLRSEINGGYTFSLDPTFNASLRTAENDIQDVEPETTVPASQITNEAPSAVSSELQDGTKNEGGSEEAAQLSAENLTEQIENRINQTNQTLDDFRSALQNVTDANELNRIKLQFANLIQGEINQVDQFRQGQEYRTLNMDQQSLLSGYRMMQKDLAKLSSRLGGPGDVTYEMTEYLKDIEYNKDLIQKLTK